CGTLRAPMVAFESMDGLRTSPDRLDGKIAFVNQQMPPYDEERDSPGYAQGVEVRLHAASEAARRGAVAALVRSLTAVSRRTPPTGALRYEPGVRKIPAAAVTIEDADLLARLAREGPVKIALSLGAHAAGRAERERRRRAARARAAGRHRAARRAHRFLGR